MVLFTILKFVLLPYHILKTFEALQSGGMEEQRKYLKYWCVLVTLNWSEPIFDFILYSWYPYYGMKSVCLVWLLSPGTTGALTLYEICLRPLLCRLVEKIDCCMKQIKRQDYKTIPRMGKTGVGISINFLKKGLMKVKFCTT